MTSTTGSAINARDFSQNTADKHRDEWLPGAMHHLVKALNGAPVAIVLDKGTGNTMVNVTLGGVRQTPGYGTFQVLVQSVYSDGTTGQCWHPLFKVGTVIELGFSRARWTALGTYRDERSAAIQRLQKEIMVELDVEWQNLPRGKWDARIFPGYVHASFTPEKLAGPVKYTWEAYRSADLVKA